MDRQRRHRRVSSLALALAFAALAAAPTLGSASTIVGRITGASIPADGQGEAVIRVIDLLTGRVVAARETDNSGRYRLTVPKGLYAVLPTVVRPGRLLQPKPTKTRLRAGQRKVVRTPVRASSAVTRRPRVGIPDDAFTGLTGELAIFNGAMNDLLITDIFNATTPPDCQITLVEVSAAFMAFYRAELALARRGLIDPATAVRPGRLLVPTRGIRGRFSISGNTVRVTAEVYKWSNKRTIGRTSVEGPADSLFALEQALVPKLVALLCDQPAPIAGTFSGSADFNQVTSLPSDVRITWSGSVVLEPRPGLPLQAGTFYSVKSGSLVADVRGSGEASNCTITGQGQFDLAPPPGLFAPFAMSVTEGAPDTYQFSLGAPAGFVTTTLSNCQDPGDNNKTKLLPLDVRILPLEVQTVSTESEYFGTGSAPGTAGEAAYTWTWRLLG